MAKISTSGTFGAEIVIDGLGAVQAGLAQAGPALRRELDKQLKGEVRKVADAAAARIHRRSGDSAGAYEVTVRKGRYQVRNRERGAIISEFAGRVNPGGLTRRGATLIKTLDASYGPTGRLAWAAWDMLQGQVLGGIAAAVREAETRLERTLR